MRTHTHARTRAFTDGIEDDEGEMNDEWWLVGFLLFSFHTTNKKKKRDDAISSGSACLFRRSHTRESTTMLSVSVRRLTKKSTNPTNIYIYKYVVVFCALFPCVIQPQSRRACSAVAKEKKNLTII